MLKARTDNYSLYGHLFTRTLICRHAWRRVCPCANLAVDQNGANFTEGGEGEIRQKKEERTSRVYLNLNFEFRRDVPAPGVTPGDSPGQPSDAVFGLAVLQFLNRIGRRQIPRDVDAKTFPVAHIYVYTCMYIYNMYM